MNTITLIRTHLLLAIVLIAIFIFKARADTSDVNTHALNFILYIPFLLIVWIYNGLTLKISSFFTNKRMIIASISPLLLLIILSLFDSFFSLSFTERLLGTLLLAIINLLGCYCLHKDY